MFQRFTDSARRVVVSAQEEARGLLHHHIGPEHLLLGICHARAGDPALTAALPDQTVAAAREHVAKYVPRGDQPPSGHMPFDPPAKRVLEQSLHESVSLGHASITPGHLLLAITRDPDSPAVRALEDMGVDPDRLREAMTNTVGTVAEQSRPDRIATLEERVRRLTEQVEELRRRLDEQDQQDEQDERHED
ncbi:MAG TPA: Clp protease N-terminal domain-containing protein [Pseudonocardiaceae bacterium]|nr:Clp protease N-terminal domain-containing protein [Pseudonocardiaceae bacterium]